ncbi:hypothetical protein GF360_03745 [candidate division WWE3 bacterium]|nr:hypothetical protein [candidate division WWE3 bacterium]
MSQTLEILLHDGINYLLPLNLFNFVMLVTGLPLGLKIAKKEVSHISTVSLILVGYTTFALNHLNSQLFPFNKKTLLIILALWSITNAIICFKDKNLQLIKTKALLKYSLAFLLISTFLYLLKSFEPEINHIERTMSLGILNALEKTTKLPPNDFWLAGKQLNYYYFGHFLISSLLKLTQIQPVPGFYVGTIWMYTTFMLLTYTTAKNLYEKFSSNKSGQKKEAALISTYFVTLGGTLYPFRWFIENVIRLLEKQKAVSFLFTEAIRPNNHRLLDIPLYSFLFHELHAHTWGFILGLMIINALIQLKSSHIKKEFAKIAWTGFLLGITFMTNSWDTLTLGVLVGSTILFYLKPRKFDLQTIAKKITGILAVITIVLITALPWKSTFTSPITGIAITGNSTPIMLLLSYWGTFLGTLILYLIAQIKSKRKVWSVKKPEITFPLVILLIGIVLLIAIEIFSVKDLLVTVQNNGFNTFWKTSLQVWIWFNLFTGIFLVEAYKKTKNKRLYAILFMVLIFTTANFSGKMLFQGVFKDKKFSGIKNGLAFWQESYPQEYEIYNYLKSQEADSSLVIAEAPGQSYTHYNLMSAFVGAESVLGWYTHEITWRNEPTELKRRQRDLYKLYTKASVEEAKKIVQDYKIDYIIVSDKERETYKDLNEKTLSRIGKVEYKTKDILLIKVI